MNTLHSSKRQVTYMGQRAEVTVIARNKSAARTGERVVAIRWIDDAIGQPVEHPAGTTIAQHVRGDGRGPNYVMFDSCVTEDPMAYAQERLS
jgi:hypothetical protein